MGIQIWFPEPKLSFAYIMCILAVTQNYCNANLIQHQLAAEM